MEIKKVLLIYPPAITFKANRDINPLPPIGLGYIASVVEDMGIDIKILDCLVRGWNHEEEVDDILVRVGISDDEIKRHITAFKPDLIGINCSFSRQHKMYHRMFDLVKQVDPKCITVAGGAHATVCPEEVLGDPNCDFIVIGEGENSFKELLGSLISGVGTRSIDGIGWKNNGETIINAKTKWIGDLDSIKSPAYHIMELDRYFNLDVSHGLRHKDRFCPVVTSRGCPAKCAFCSAEKVWGRKYRTRSVGNIIKEMKLLKNRYGIEELMFEDDNVTADPNRAKELFSVMVKEKLSIVWDTPNGVGVWTIDESMLELMKASGCLRINFPVESGSQRVLDEVINKPLNLSKVRKLISYCRKIKLDYGMFLVIGMPGETITEMWQSFRFAASCGVYTPHISVATPYPGTRLLEDCKKNSFLKKEFVLEDLFIRSFLIKTDRWDSRSLENIMLKGSIYLKLREAFSRPADFAVWAMKKLMDPKRSFQLFKKITDITNF